MFEDRDTERQVSGGKGLTREQIYDLQSNDEIDRLIEESLGEDGDVKNPRQFSTDIHVCFQVLVSGFQWFRLSRNLEEDEYWCEVRIFPKDFQARGVYFKHLARSTDPAIAICKAYLIYANRRGNSYGDSRGGRGGYRGRDRDDRRDFRDRGDRGDFRESGRNSGGFNRR